MHHFTEQGDFKISLKLISASRVNAYEDLYPLLKQEAANESWVVMCLLLCIRVNSSCKVSRFLWISFI